MADIKLLEEVKKFQEFCGKMTSKLRDPNSQVDFKLNQLSEQFGTFFGSASSQIRTRFTYYIQKQIRRFLREFVQSKLYNLTNPKIDPFVFIEQLCDVWSDYERFIYAIKFYTNSADNTFKSFHKFAAKFQLLLVTQQNNDKLAHKTDRQYKNQVSPVAVMSVNQLKQFLIIEKLKDPLINNFQKIFCTFMKQEREGLNTPRDKINQALQFAEAIHLDFECDCVRRGDRLKIIKALNATAPVNRKSTADKFFEDTFTKSIFNDCENYYRNWVDTKSILLSSSQQQKQILKFIEAEQGRSKFYIHDNRNITKYTQIIDNNLIQYKLEERLAKRSGFSYFLSSYQLDKPQMMEQINNFWSVWKRIYFNQNNKSKQIILGIYQTYLKQEAGSVSQAFEKPSQFIQQAIKLNKKNLQIVGKLLGNVLQFNRKRVQIMECLLAMKYVEKQGIRQYIGAKHWASYLNSKLKVKYSKTEKYSENQEDLVGLFKLFIHKLMAINEHCKLLNSRLLEDIDMSLEGQYSNAIDLELKILDEIKKQAAENEIKSIQSCIKDVQSSLDLRSKLKQTKKMAPFGFFNQIIRKSGNYWVDTSMYDIQPPAILRNCITAIRSQLESENLVFQLHNGTSLFTATINKQMHKFQLRNVYLMVLLLIDQKPNKRIFYTDLLKEIRPIGILSIKSHLQLLRNLIQLTTFGILKCSKQFTAQNCDIENWTASDYFEINLGFKPLKKMECYRTPMLINLPDFLKKAFTAKLSVVDSEQKKIEKQRRFRVEGDCVRLLKHAQTLDGGKGTIGVITLDELMKGMRRENNVNPKYLKEVVQKLITDGLCERVEDKKNTFKYKS